MITGGINRAERWLTVLWLLAFSALVLIASGCEPGSHDRSHCKQVNRAALRGVSRDTEPTAIGSRILAGYETGEPEPSPPVDRPLSALPITEPPVVPLPGPPDRPWTGIPRTVAVQPMPLPTPVTPIPVRRPPANPTPVTPVTPVPTAQTGLRAGDSLYVLVDGHPEFSGRWTIRADGFLEVPDGGAFGPELLPGAEFARSVGLVTGLSPEEAGQGIARALKPYLVNPPAVKVTRLAGREG